MDTYRRIDLDIAGLSIRLELDQPVAMENSFAPFLAPVENPDFTAVFRRVDKLPPVPEEILHSDNCFRVHPDGQGGYVRSFFDAPRDLTPYALATYDYPAGQIRVDYLEKGRSCVSQLSNSFFHVGIEAVMLDRGRIFFHSACVETGMGGILFSGPSGIGKSTQAALWQAHRGSRLINGDRTILSRDGEGYRAWGSPYAGSSRCHVSDSLPVKAILMLRQGTRCAIRRLPPGEAFRRLFAGMTLYSWDRASTERACDLTAELSARVPVFEFVCTADRAAVEFLENALARSL